MSPYHWTAHIVLALALAVATLGWRQATTKASLLEAKQALTSERATGRALVRREILRQGTARASERASAALSGARASHPTWANEPVPQEVQDALAQP